MAPRTLATLAHALHAAPGPDAALVALAEALSELDRGAMLALYSYDARRAMLRERATVPGAVVQHEPLELTLDHLPAAIMGRVEAGAEFVDVAERTSEFARLLGFAPIDSAWLTLRGLQVEGQLAALLVLHEPKKLFGARTLERFTPAVALFELAFARFSEREARQEAVQTLEDVTQRVHAEYVRRLEELEVRLSAAARVTPSAGVAASVDDARLIALAQNAAHAEEEARRATRKADSSEQQLGAAIGHLESAHIELHRRSIELRQATRTLTLLDGVLTLASETEDARALVDRLLSLVGEDMQAQRVSLLLRAPEPGYLFLAAARGVAPHVNEGARIRIGEGVAGRVAEARVPLLVEDTDHAASHPLLRDQYFTTGSFISFPLVQRDEVLGVVNLTNRARQGVFTDADVERVRLLAAVIGIVASEARLAERLLGALHAG